MNTYSIQFLISFITSLVLSFLIHSLSSKSKLNKHYLAYIYSISLWSFIEFELSNSSTLEEFRYWNNLDTIWPICITLLFHFILIYTGNRKLYKNKVFITFFYIISVLASLILYFLTSRATYKELDWSWDTIFQKNDGMIYAIISSIFSLYAIVSLIMCIAYYIKGKNQYKKTSDLFVIASLAVPIILGIIVDVVFAQFLRIYFPFTTSSLFVFSNIFIAYAIWRKHVFVVDPSRVASNIIQSISDAVFLMDKDKWIQFMNKSAIELTGYTLQDLKKQDISIIFDKLDNRIIENIYDKKELISNNLNIKTKSGHIIPVSLASTQLIDKTRGIIGYVWLLRDISDLDEDKRLLERQKETLQKTKNELERKNTELNQVNKKILKREYKMNKLREEIDSLMKNVQ